MPSDVEFEAHGGTITTAVEILKQHIGVTAIDLWRDTDEDGDPDKFLRRIKEANRSENQLVPAGAANTMDNKVLQWVWSVSQPLDADEGWTVRIRIQQDGAELAGFPRELNGSFAKGSKHGTFQTWARLVAK